MSHPVITIDAAFTEPLTQSRPRLPSYETARETSRGVKPAGLPTVPDMIREALRHYYGLGATAVAPAAISSYVRGRYWPNLPKNVVGPTAWRMSQEGNLEKNPSGYAPLPEDRPATHGRTSTELEEIVESEVLEGIEDESAVPLEEVDDDDQLPFSPKIAAAAPPL